MQSPSFALGALAMLGLASCATPERASLRPEMKAARPPIALGKPVSEADIAPWNIDIQTATGAGLPPGRGTVAQGKAIYEARCASCHGADAKGGPQYGTMVGGVGSFVTDKRVLTPGSMYPYAPILFDYIRRAMPMDQPQSLSPDEVYAVSAYLLHLNGLAPADAVMDANSLPKVQMPNRNGFIVDDRPDTKALRCMTDCTGFAPR